MTRLPLPGGDDGTWGDVLNDFLGQAHNPDGSLKQLSQSQIQNLVSDLAGKVSATDSRLSDSRPATDASVAALVNNAASSTSGALKAAFVATDTPEAHGAVGDGTTDDTAAVNAAIAAVQAAGGGTVLFTPGKTYRCLGAITPVYSGPSNAPVQKPVRLVSTSGPGGWNGYWSATPLNGGATLDLRYDGTDGQHPAKIDTRGAGFLEISYLTLLSGGSDDFPFLQTTNTAVFAHHNTVVGNAAKTGTACVQDVFMLGSTTTTIGSTATAPFQGYGSKISENYFARIRRGIYGQVYANAVVVRDNTFSSSCGNSSGGAILFDGDPAGTTGASDTGCLIEGNLIEATNYQYGIVIRHSVRQQVIANQCYDATTTTKAAVLFDNSLWNLLIDGFSTPGLAGVVETGTSVGTTTRLASDQSVPQRFPAPIHAYGQVRSIAAGTDSADVRGIAGSGDQGALWVTAGNYPYPTVGLATYTAAQVTDAGTTNGSTTVTSATAGWTTQHEGLPISGPGIPNGTRIQSVQSSTQITLSKTATATATGVTLTFVSYATPIVQQIAFARQHIVSKGAIGTATANAGAGTGATISASGTDTVFTLTLTTGTSPASGQQCSVGFGINWASTPKLVMTPKNAAAAGQMTNVYLTNTTANTFLQAVTALAASTQYIWDLHAIS